MSAASPNLRELLTGIGIGQFNATMVIQYMLISPATTDPKSAQIILLVQHIQRALYELGATSVALSGRLDTQTAAALEDVVGPNWERMPWSASVAAILTARKQGRRLQPILLANEPYTPGQPTAVGGPLDFLPDVPGGFVTYGVAAYLLYRHFSRKRHA